jgi:hypothetical protein
MDATLHTERDAPPVNTVERTENPGNQQTPPTTEELTVRDATRTSDASDSGIATDPDAAPTQLDAEGSTPTAPSRKKTKHR